MTQIQEIFTALCDPPERPIHSDPGINQDGKPTDYEFLDGLVSFMVNGVAPGGTAIVTITFPTTFPDGSKYYKVDSDGFYEFTGAFIVGNTVTLTLTDGGSGDNDNTDNGELDDPGGIAVVAICADIASFAEAYGSLSDDDNYSFACDGDGDSDVDGSDLAELAAEF